MTLKIFNASGLSNEEQLTFQQKIQEIVRLHELTQDLTINSDQSLLSYLTAGNTTLETSGTNLTLLKQQEKITRTFFYITVGGHFLSKKKLMSKDIAW